MSLYVVTLSKLMAPALLLSLYHSRLSTLGTRMTACSIAGSEVAVCVSACGMPLARLSSEGRR
jgi:hypothetical protein